MEKCFSELFVGLTGFHFVDFDFHINFMFYVFPKVFHFVFQNVTVCLSTFFGWNNLPDFKYIKFKFILSVWKLAENCRIDFHPFFWYISLHLKPIWLGILIHLGFLGNWGNAMGTYQTFDEEISCYDNDDIWNSPFTFDKGNMKFIFIHSVISLNSFIDTFL